MRDGDYTKAQLMEESAELQGRLSEPETSGTDEKWFQTLLLQSIQGFLIIQEDFRIIFTNPAFAEISGYSIEELLNLPPHKVRAMVHPDDRALVWGRFRDRLKGKDIPPRYEYRAIKKDGSVLWLEMIATRIEYRGKPAIYGAIVDITERKEAEETLRESENNYKALTESSITGIFIHQDGRYVFVNDRFAEIHGYKNEELLGKDHLTLIHPDEREIIKQKREKRLKGQAVPSRYEVKRLRKDGHTIWCEMMVTVIPYRGRPAIMGNLIDITDRKRVEQALRENEKKYRTILETIEEGYYESDTEGNFTFFNDPLCEMFGYPGDELRGLNYRRLMEEESAKKVYQIFNEVFKTGKPSKGFDHEVTRKDGARRFVEVSASLRKDPKGKPIGFRGIIRDVTDRKQAEKEINRRQQYLESVLYSAPDAIVTLDASHRTLEWNPGAEQIFGYTRDEVVGKNLDDLVTRPNVLDETKTLTQKVLSGEKVQPRETVRYRKDGTEVNVIAGGSPIIIDGVLQGVVAVYTDITKLKKAEEEKKALESQLQYAQKMEAVGTLAGGIAHNFNNLLMGIQGNTSLMLLETDPRHPNYERLKSIEKAVQSGAKLTRQLLGYARRGRYEVKALNVNRLVRETSETFAAAKREIRVHLELTDDIWGILADQGQIEQVLLNLYVNAIDAMPTGGDLVLKTEKVTHRDMKDKPYQVKPGNYVLITVRDTGVGMDEKIIERIFEPFFTTKGFTKGTGLGLASVYGIVKANGGYIDVKSKKGQGTTFSIYLPASRKKLREEHERSSEIITGTETILLADDEKMILDVGTQILETMGYTVMVARGGKEALDIYEENIDTIDLVILDMIMPDMGGGEAFDRLKEINPGVKVLLSSGYSIDGKAQEIMARGCGGFIQKPFSVEDLSQKIREILDQRNS
ncbi:MAG: PAS domain S-box protein [Deltaproteobacteria bacterium]|nr:PAS domain S-box protein [Deltaproteobacteria bacterium]